MNTITKNFILIFLIIFIIYFLLNWATGGFINQYLRVKNTKGRRKLLLVKGTGDSYFSNGVVSEGILKFRNRTKEDKTLTCEEEDIIHILGIQLLIVDDTKNICININNFVKHFNGYDASRVDNLIARIIMANLDSIIKKLLIFALIGIAIVLIISLASVFFIYQTKQIINSGSINVICSNIPETLNATIRQL